MCRDRRQRADRHQRRSGADRGRPDRGGGRRVRRRRPRPRRGDARTHRRHRRGFPARGARPIRWTPPCASRRWCRAAPSLSTRPEPRPGSSCPPTRVRWSSSSRARRASCAHCGPRRSRPRRCAAAAAVPPAAVRLLRYYGLSEAEIAATLRALEESRDIGGVEVTTCLRRSELEVDLRPRPGAEDAATWLAGQLAERHADRLSRRRDEHRRAPRWRPRRRPHGRDRGVVHRRAAGWPADRPAGVVPLRRGAW